MWEDSKKHYENSDSSCKGHSHCTYLVLVSSQFVCDSNIFYNNTENRRVTFLAPNRLLNSNKHMCWVLALKLYFFYGPYENCWRGHSTTKRLRIYQHPHYWKIHYERIYFEKGAARGYVLAGFQGTLRLYGSKFALRSSQFRSKKSAIRDRDGSIGQLAVLRCDFGTSPDSYKVVPITKKS